MAPKTSNTLLRTYDCEEEQEHHPAKAHAVTFRLAEELVGHHAFAEEDHQACTGGGMDTYFLFIGFLFTAASLSPSTPKERI